MREQESRGALLAMLAAIQPTGKDLFPDDPSVHGWHYRDMPGKLSLELWDELLSIIGHGHYRLIATSAGTDSQGVAWQRGQLLISPEGIERLRQMERSPA